MSKGNNLQSLFCGILLCISVTALVIACLAFTNKGGGKGEYYKELGPVLPFPSAGTPPSSAPGTGPCGVLAWAGAQACSPPRNCRDKEGNPVCCCKNRPHSLNPFCTWGAYSCGGGSIPGPGPLDPNTAPCGMGDPGLRLCSETGTDDNGNSTCHCKNNGKPCTWGAYSCP